MHSLGCSLQQRKHHDTEVSCPACGKPVFLRHGNVRIAHFAHRPGVGTPECELFVATDDIRNWSVVPTHPTSPVRPVENILPARLQLALEPGGVTRQRSPRRWELCITLPKSPNPHGQISFNCGGGIYRNVSLSTLALGPRTYPVDLDAPDFAASWISYESSAIRRSHSTSCSGLETRQSHRIHRYV